MSQYASLNIAVHLDRCGMLRKDILIVASPESIVIIKRIQDSGRLLPRGRHGLFLSPAAGRGL
jgi:hypothetical protein